MKCELFESNNQDREFRDDVLSCFQSQLLRGTETTEWVCPYPNNLAVVPLEVATSKDRSFREETLRTKYVCVHQLLGDANRFLFGVLINFKS